MRLVLVLALSLIVSGSVSCAISLGRTEIPAPPWPDDALQREIYEELPDGRYRCQRSHDYITGELLEYFQGLEAMDD